MLYLPIGAGWLVLYRLGVRPLGFADVIVLLTGVHFHYTGFVLPIVAGMVGRWLRAESAQSDLSVAGGWDHHFDAVDRCWHHAFATG